MKAIFPSLLLVWLPVAAWAGKPLTEATFSQVINDVKVLAPAARTPVVARLHELFKAPELLRTGADSLAELTAADQTITRVGANTVFSFEASGRSINLEQGCLLFHTPKGRGGGAIKTRSASAAVLGTTLLVVTTRGGGFKAIVLEGRGQVRLPNGDFRLLQAGQLVFVLPGVVRFGPVLEINLGKLVKGSRLVNGFEARLPSHKRIEVEVERQGRKLERGEAEDTELLVGDHATEKEVEVVDSDVLERAVAKKETEDEHQPGLDPALQSALDSDVSVNSSVLEPGRVFTDQFTVNLRGVDFTQRGFAGRRITLNSPLLDLSPYTTGTLGSFALLAADKIVIPGSVTFQGALPPGTPFEFSLTAAEGFDIAPGLFLYADRVGDFALHSGDTIDLEDMSLHNLSGNGIEVSTVANSGQVLGDVNLNFVSIQGAPIEIHGADVNIENNSTLSLASGPGTRTLTVEARDNLFIDNSTLAGSGIGPASACLKALNTLELVDVSFLGLTEISLYAGTVNLENVAFPGGVPVTIGSQLGLLAPNPNTGQPSLPGYVNFIDNVTYGGSPAQLQVAPAVGGAGPGNAINIVVHNP